MKRALRIAAVLGAATIAACFSKPGKPHATGDGGIDGRIMVDAPRIDAMIDGRMIDGPLDAPDCTKDDFNTTTLAPCGTWGMASVFNATISRANMQLDFNFSSTSSVASCATKNPIYIVNGTSIHVLQFGNSLTSFGLGFGNDVSKFVVNRPSGMYTWSLQCPASSSNTNPGTIPGSTPPVTWWQFKVTSPSSNMVRVAIELSPDGTLWGEYQSCTFPGSQTSFANVTLEGSGSGATTASFDDFNVKNCP